MVGISILVLLVLLLLESVLFSLDTSRSNRQGGKHIVAFDSNSELLHLLPDNMGLVSNCSTFVVGVKSWMQTGLIGVPHKLIMSLKTCLFSFQSLQSFCVIRKKHLPLKSNWTSFRLSSYEFIYGITK